MSETDSFIEEVSEEVRKDRLFALMRKYGWIAILLVVLLVGGAAFNEYRKSQARAAAERAGDQIVAALQNDEPDQRIAALQAIETSSARIDGIIAMLVAAEIDDPSKVAATLDQVANNPELPAIYRDAATLKILIAADLDPAERIERLTPLATAGAPYRLLAEEQIALAEAESGDTDAAIERLIAMLQDGEATSGLRRRVSQLIVALGGQLEPA